VSLPCKRSRVRVSSAAYRCCPRCRRPQPAYERATAFHRYHASVPLEGEYAPPDPADWVRDQIVTWERFWWHRGYDPARTGLPIVIVINRGVLSGQLRRTPLMRVEHGGRYLAVGSRVARQRTRRGSRTFAQIRMWRSGTVLHAATTSPTRPRRGALDVVERAVAAYPPYAQYQLRTERLIPVFVLEPAADPAPPRRRSLCNCGDTASRPGAACRTSASVATPLEPRDSCGDGAHLAGVADLPRSG